MTMHISAAELLLGVGDFLTIYLFGYMQRTFFEKKNWIKDKMWLVPVIYLLDWCMIFAANLQEIPPLNFLSMLAAYMIPLFLIYRVKRFRDLTNFWFYMVGTMVMEVINSGQFLRMAVLLVIVNIAVFVILEKYTGLMKHEMELVQEKTQLESDAYLMEIAAENMKERLQITESSIQKDRLMRHDRRHFEALLYQLLEEGNTEEAKRYLAERLAMEPQPGMRYCENTTVNAAISHYMACAKREKISMTVSANIPGGLSVDELELAIVISNLLENAVNACRKLPETERYVNLTAKYKNQLLLEIENSCERKAVLDEDGYPFSREENHGIGTRSVLAFVNKTDSEICYLPEETRFRVRMII